VVGDDAAMLLAEDWYDHIPDAEKWRARPGYYALVAPMDPDARVARWTER
jgi:hypothetical protein